MTPLLPGITHLGQCRFLSLGEAVPGLLPRLLLLDLLKVAHLDEPARLLLLNDQANRLGSPALSRQGNAVVGLVLFVEPGQLDDPTGSER